MNQPLRVHQPADPPAPAVSLSLDAPGLRAFLGPVIAAAVRETLAQVEADRAQLGDRLAYSEEEAARLMGLQPHQLRDERRRGRITASQVVGRRIRYSRQDLLNYLAARRVGE